MPLTFNPSADPTTQGVLQSITNCIPTIRGIMGAPSPVAMAFPPLEEASKGAATVELLDGSRRAFVGAESYLYEATDGGFSLAGTGFTTGDNRFMFTNFGNAVIACNGANPLVASTGATFTGIAGAPRAKIVESVGEFVLAFDCDNGVNHLPDQWWSCALGDYTDWTPSASTQAANGRFLDTPGGVTAAKRIGDGIAVYKRRGMYYGQYVGGDIIWQWSQVASNAGCVGSMAIANAGGVHVFIGPDDLWAYDGSLPRSIGGTIKRWFFADADPTALFRIQSHYDRVNGHVWFFYASKNSGGVLDSAIIYNMETGGWGHASQTITDVMNYVEPGTTYTGATGTYDGQPALSFDSPFWRAGSEYPVVIGQDTRLYSLVGACQSASMTLWDIGDGVTYQTIDTIIPRFSTAPQTAVMSRQIRNTQSEAWTDNDNCPLTQWQRFNFRGAYRWNKLIINTTGDFELIDLSVKLLNRGR